MASVAVVVESKRTQPPPPVIVFKWSSDSERQPFADAWLTIRALQFVVVCGFSLRLRRPSRG
jgi:hypothetical protein